MALILINVMPSSAYADTSPSINSITNEDYIEIDATKYIDDAEALNSKVDDALKTSDHIKIVNLDGTENSILDTSSLVSENGEYTPQSAAGQTIYEVQ